MIESTDTVREWRQDGAGQIKESRGDEINALLDPIRYRMQPGISELVDHHFLLVTSFKYLAKALLRSPPHRLVGSSSGEYDALIQGTIDSIGLG
jgi:hypothetical protein